ncbi:MAG: hypothetical protein R2864_06050 [Syntrophotaleaceae bacterium]
MRLATRRQLCDVGGEQDHFRVVDQPFVEGGNRSRSGDWSVIEHPARWRGSWHHFRQHATDLFTRKDAGLFSRFVAGERHATETWQSSPSGKGELTQPLDKVQVVFKVAAVLAQEKAGVMVTPKRNAAVEVSDLSGVRIRNRVVLVWLSPPAQRRSCLPC